MSTWWFDAATITILCSILETQWTGHLLLRPQWVFYYLFFFAQTDQDQRDKSIKYIVSFDFELENVENLRSTENSQIARQSQTVKDFQTSKSFQSSSLYLDEPPVGWNTQSMSIIGSQLDYCASSYPKSTESFYSLSLDDTSQHSNYKNGSPEQTALAGENLYYPSLISRNFVFSVSRPPILELSPSDFRAAKSSTFIYQEHILSLSMNGQD